MYQTIQLSSRVSVQGEIVETLGNGDVVIRNGATLYRGRPLGAEPVAYAVRDAATARVSGSRLNARA